MSCYVLSYLMVRVKLYPIYSRLPIYGVYAALGKTNTVENIRMKQKQKELVHLIHERKVKLAQKFKITVSRK